MLERIIQTLHALYDHTRTALAYGKTALTRLIKKLLKRKAHAAKEKNWLSVLHSRDQLFFERSISRYRAHFSSSLALPALSQKSTATSITQDAWDILSKAALHNKREPLIDVIMPITDSYNAVISALYQLLDTPSSIPFRVVAILSHHPDHKLTDKLRRLQELDLFDLLQVEAEEPLISLINFAMQRHETRDIVLLSSACEVPEGWLESFHLTLQSCATTTASISPWSTAGGITGYPDNAGSLSHQLDSKTSLSAMCQDVFADAPCPVLPEPLLHCCYITREAIHVSGLLPEEHATLAKSLTAWANKASDKGFEHLWLPRLCVGSTQSSAPSNQVKSPALTATPKHQTIDESLESARAEYCELLDRNRLLGCVHTNTLVITGIVALLPPDTPHLTLSADSSRAGALRLGAPDARLFPHISFWVDDDIHYLRAIISLLPITHIAVYHLAGFPSRMLDYILRISAKFNLPYHLHISDDYLICPGLIGVAKQCDAADLESSYQSFITTQPLDSDGMPLWQWRERSKRLLNHATQITYSNEAIAALHARYFGAH